MKPIAPSDSFTHITTTASLKLGSCKEGGAMSKPGALLVLLKSTSIIYILTA